MSGVEPELLAFLESFDSIRALCAEEKASLAEQLVTARFAKGTVLLAQGQVPSTCWFVLRGCVRQYFVAADGTERTVEFYCEGQAAVAHTGYSRGLPSRYFLSCVEDTLALVGDSSSEQSSYASFPVLAGISRAMLETGMGDLQDSLARFKSMSGEERYEWVCEYRSELVSRVPQYLLADYLGVSPETLSRIRKRRANPRGTRG